MNRNANGDGVTVYLIKLFKSTRSRQYPFKKSTTSANYLKSQQTQPWRVSTLLTTLSLDRRNGKYLLPTSSHGSQTKLNCMEMTTQHNDAHSRIHIVLRANVKYGVLVIQGITAVR